MTGSTRPDDLATIRMAEERIADRLARAGATDTALAAAQEGAARTLADARARAAALAQAQADHIEAVGRTRCVEEDRAGTKRADRLRSVASGRLPGDVAMILAAVLPRSEAAADGERGKR